MNFLQSSIFFFSGAGPEPPPVGAEPLVAAHRLDVDAAQLCGRGGAERAGVRGGRLRRQQQALPLLRRGLRPGEGHLAPGETQRRGRHSLHLLQ